MFDRDPLDRFRRPRFIAKDGVVRPFNHFDGMLMEGQSNITADGQYALRQASDGKYLRDNYVFHVVYHFRYYSNIRTFLAKKKL